MREIEQLCHIDSKETKAWKDYETNHNPEAMNTILKCVKKRAKIMGFMKPRYEKKIEELENSSIDLK